MPLAMIYVRVSSPGQEDGTSPGSQVEACVAEAAAKGYEVRSEHILVEVFTGFVLERPVLTQARNLAASGEVQALFALTADRLSRNGVHLLMLIEEIKSAGVAIHFVHGSSDTSPEGQLVLIVEGYAARRERESTARRTMDGKLETALGGRFALRRAAVRVPL